MQPRGIPLVYASFVYWKMGACQNATPGFTRNIYTKEQAHLFLNKQFSDIFVHKLTAGRSSFSGKKNK